MRTKRIFEHIQTLFIRIRPNFEVDGDGWDDFNDIIKGVLVRHQNCIDTLRINMKTLRALTKIVFPLNDSDDSEGQLEPQPKAINIFSLLKKRVIVIRRRRNPAAINRNRQAQANRRNRLQNSGPVFPPAPVPRPRNVDPEIVVDEIEANNPTTKSPQNLQQVTNKND